MINGLPEKLQMLRMRYRYSQKQVAEKLYISPSIVSCYETGERTPSTEVLLALSYLYNCSTDFLLGKQSPESNLMINADGLTDSQIQAIRILIDTIRDNNS